MSQLKNHRRPGPAAGNSFAKLTSSLEDSWREIGVHAAALRVVRADTVVYEGCFGAIDSTSLLPVASASKWVSAVLLLSLVDDGLLALDEPIGSRLPYFRGRHAAITLRQLLACTSGLPPRVSWQSSPELTLDTAARRIADVQLQAEPGTAFIYGGLGYQVAGALAEAATGQGWHELFGQRIVKPLGLRQSCFGTLRWKARDFDPRRHGNPRIGGALGSTLGEYSAFLGALVGSAVHGRRGLLSEQSLSELFRDQSGGVPIQRTMHWNPTTRYSLGAWVEESGPDQSGALRLSSPGTLGWYPWIDRGRALTGVVAVNHDLRQLTRVYSRLPETIGALVDQIEKADLASASKVDAASENVSFWRRLLDSLWHG